MKFDQLQYFVETARRQHIGQAARALHISPSAISHSITALEEELGKPLFEKQGRQIRLTHHGKLLLDRAEFLLAEAERVREEVAGDAVELRGHYRIAATTVLSSEFLTPVWLGIQDRHPALSATLHSVKSGEVLARVDAGEIDLGFCLSPHSGHQHEQEVLHEGRLVFAFGKRHPFLTDKRVETLGRFPSMAAMGAPGIENCENHPSFRKLGLNTKTSNLFDSYDVAIAALRTQKVWTLLPDFLAERFRGEFETFVPKGWDAPYRVVAVWPKYRIRTHALDLLVEEVKAALVAGKLGGKAKKTRTPQRARVF